MSIEYRLKRLTVKKKHFVNGPEYKCIGSFLYNRLDQHYIFYTTAGH